MAFRKYLAAAVAALWMMSAPAASAQTAPNWYYGKVPTTAEWAAAWSSKQNYLGASPCLVTGCVMQGPLVTVAPSGRAGFNLTPGAGAPSSLFNGDLWVTSSGLFVQINGATVGPLLSAVNPTLANLTVTGAFTATGLVTNADLANASTTVNGITCTLGSTCTITASAGTISVGSTTVAGSTTGHVLYNNAGTLGDYAVSGTGSVAMTSAAAMTSPTLTTPVLSGTITGTYTIGGTPSIPGTAINSGTISGSYMSAINLASTSNGGVSGTLPIGSGGTGQTTATAAIGALMPTPTRAGDVALWSGSAWTTCAGNNSGTQVLTENAAGACSWTVPSGVGTVTSVGLTAGSGIAISGSPVTSSGSMTVSGAVPNPQGRLTLQANTPVLLAASCGGGCFNQTTLRYDAYVGNQVPYFNGSVDLLDTIANNEVTDAMVAAASNGQVVMNNVYDVWWVHGGANRICVAMSQSGGAGGGWASDTGGSNSARGTGFSQLDNITRPYITNKNSLSFCYNGSTNYGPVTANQGTYLGTFYATGNGYTSFFFSGGAGAGGAGLTFGLWNMYNRVDFGAATSDSTTSWNYTTAAWRVANNGSGMFAQYVVGVAEDAVSATYNAEASTSSTSVVASVGVGLDVTNNPGGTPTSTWERVTNGNVLAPIHGRYYGTAGVGLHTFWAIEYGCTTCSYYGNTVAGGGSQSGLSFNGKF